MNDSGLTLLKNDAWRETAVDIVTVPCSNCGAKFSIMTNLTNEQLIKGFYCEEKC